MRFIFGRTIWKNWGGIYFYGFEKTVSATKRFELEQDIPREMYGKEYSFIDVGAGPFSRCGHITDKVALNAISVDPLASVYRSLKHEHGVENGITLKTGFVELLSRDFGENTFDMVHMSNSLDHSFSPIYGIYQMLYICKVGGMVILRHAENEAEREGYKGLHQWNLSLHNEENSFIVWRNNERYDVRDIFKEYADVECYADILEENGTWVHNKVILRKKKDITIPKASYYDQMMSITYDYLLEILLEKENEVPEAESKLENICNRIKGLYYNPEKFTKFIKGKKIDSISIYGMGFAGRGLLALAEKCDLHISHLIDRNSIVYKNMQTINLEQYMEKNDKSIIVITARTGDLKQECIRRGKKDVLYIEELLDEVDMFN